jgi:hypothetical protein
MRDSSLDQGGGCLFTLSLSWVHASGLNIHPWCYPCVLLTAKADDTSDLYRCATIGPRQKIKSVTGLTPYS